MAETGETGFAGFPPEVLVTERMLLEQVPEEERRAFMQYLGTRYELTRTGEPVFAKAAYKQWKQLH